MGIQGESCIGHCRCLTPVYKVHWDPFATGCTRAGRLLINDTVPIEPPRDGIRGMGRLRRACRLDGIEHNIGGTVTCKTAEVRFPRGNPGSLVGGQEAQVELDPPHPIRRRVCRRLDPARIHVDWSVALFGRCHAEAVELIALGDGVLEALRGGPANPPWHEDSGGRWARDLHGGRRRETSVGVPVLLEQRSAPEHVPIGLAALNLRQVGISPPVPSPVSRLWNHHRGGGRTGSFPRLEATQTFTDAGRPAPIADCQGEVLVVVIVIAVRADAVWSQMRPAVTEQFHAPAGRRGPGTSTWREADPRQNGRALPHAVGPELDKALSVLPRVLRGGPEEWFSHIWPTEVWSEARAPWAQLPGAGFEICVGHQRTEWVQVPQRVYISRQQPPAEFGCWSCSFQTTQYLQPWSPPLPSRDPDASLAQEWFIASWTPGPAASLPLHRILAVLDGFRAMHDGKVNLLMPAPPCPGWVPSAADWAEDPSVVVAHELHLHEHTDVQRTGHLVRMHSSFPCFLSGRWISIDEGLGRNCPWAGASIVTANGLFLQLATQGTCIDAHLAAWRFALAIPGVQSGDIVVFYDAESPLALIAQAAAAAIPMATCRAMFGRFGPRLGRLLQALARESSVRTRKVCSHTVGKPNGLADHHVPLFSRSKDGQWSLPTGWVRLSIQGDGMGACIDHRRAHGRCMWIPPECWPLEWKGIFRPCLDMSPRGLLLNWEAGLSDLPVQSRGCWQARGRATEKLIMLTAARRTWNCETALALGLRLVQTLLRKRGLPREFWVPNRQVMITRADPSQEWGLSWSKDTRALSGCAEGSVAGNSAGCVACIGMVLLAVDGKEIGSVEDAERELLTKTAAHLEFQPTHHRTWSPTALGGRRLPCGFGCKKCRDGHADEYECVRRPALAGLRADIAQILSVLGLDKGAAPLQAECPEVVARGQHRLRPVPPGKLSMQAGGLQGQLLPKAPVHAALRSPPPERSP
eukprot:gene5052-biopygen10472